MELVKSSSSIMSYDPNPLKHIELVARNCYKSEDKITDESCIKFVHNLKDRKHMAMLEFYPFYFHIPRDILSSIVYINQLPNIDGDFKYYDRDLEFVEASCNLRTAIMINNENGYLAEAIVTKHPELQFLFNNVDYRDFTVLVTETEVHVDLHYLTGRFICDRGVSHELVRHRKCSFAQESTRYCNYGKDEHMKFIIPSWCDNVKEGKYTIESDELNNADTLWYNLCLGSERTYNYLIKSNNWLPQQARSVLPNSLKTEIIVQTRLSEWKHIFEQRCAKTAHPDMQALMIPFFEEVCKSNTEYYTYLNM